MSRSEAAVYVQDTETQKSAVAKVIVEVLTFARMQTALGNYKVQSVGDLDSAAPEKTSTQFTQTSTT